MTITEAMVAAGAKHLRNTQQAGKRLTPWEETPRATKKKWLALSEGTLRAAFAALPSLPTPVEPEEETRA
ncbi:hypothetical protein GCM10008023_06200 [Sphingomonas glacialis]|uniref:Uncharacterized protein n=1 Tax=Sphingomonas glacialis TaxID=658225 RepID=A0ABQ3L9L3_9SPHN|nr:hypothetical protein [Sphingomonas glacialis]GHH09473.1 hypothetical protein GCM10008023_06200 [Sphingomonas glacialis]